MTSTEFRARTMYAIDAAWANNQRRILVSLPIGVGRTSLMQDIVTRRPGPTLWIFPTQAALKADQENGLVESVATEHGPFYPLANPMDGLAVAWPQLTPDGLALGPPDIDLLIVQGVGQDHPLLDTLAVVERIGAPNVLWTTPMSGAKRFPFLDLAEVQAVIDVSDDDQPHARSESLPFPHLS